MKESQKLTKRIVLAVCLFVCLITFYGRKYIRTILHSESSEKRPFSLRTNSCEDPSLVFAKTHKTGSTTLLMVLKRYEERRRLTSKEPLPKAVAFPHPFVGGYPGSFRREFTVVTTSSKVKKLRKGRVSFLMNHIRWDEDEVKKTIHPGAKYVTILRKPLRQFESSFHFYYSKYASGRPVDNEVSCHKFPHLFVTGGRWVNISEYLSLAETSLNESAPWFFRSRNYQAYDLGLDPLNMRDDYVLQQAKKLDDTFDLVLILEHLLESLVLLKDLLCMDWEELLPLPRKHNAKYQRHEFDNAEKRIVRKLTSQDQLLYDYFNATLWRKIEEYGRKKMENDVLKLKEMIGEVDSRKKPKKRVKRTKKSSQFPQRMREDEAKFLIPVLMEKAKGSSYELSIVKNIACYMAENYGWCPLLG